MKLFVAVYYYLSIDFKQKDDNINGKIGRKMMWQSCCWKDNRHIWIKRRTPDEQEQQTLKGRIWFNYRL